MTKSKFLGPSLDPSDTSRVDVWERYRLAAQRVLGRRSDYGEHLRIEHGRVYETGTLKEHTFQIPSIVEVQSDQDRLTIRTSENEYRPTIKAKDATRFIEDLRLVTAEVERLDRLSTGGASASDESSSQTGEQSWEYKHVYLPASSAEDKPRGVWGGMKAEVSDYPSGRIEAKLNDLGGRGWELVSMEPHWFYERVGVSAAMEVTRPKAIVGWYCTLRRRI
ncbi:MAG: hypothetical protein WD379_08520 [Dehalococcoidia bacterium]